jgi:hypothetical protein
MEQVKQTATEWLYEQLTSTWFDKTSGQHILEQAKEMEKERIEIAYNKGTVHGIDYPESTLPITGEQYYEQTYGGKDGK